jgi:Fe-S oxidoreductase
VIHHSELINNLIGSGKIELEQDSTSPSVTYHDPCYLGRHNQQFEQPRNIMKSLSEDLREMPSNRNQSFCCGAGGAQVWKEEGGGSKINITRYEQAKSTLSQTIAVACPFCLTMLTDASKEDDHPMDVLDIAELVAQKMIRK